MLFLSKISLIFRGNQIKVQFNALLMSFLTSSEFCRASTNLGPLLCPTTHKIRHHIKRIFAGVVHVVGAK